MYKPGASWQNEPRHHKSRFHKSCFLKLATVAITSLIVATLSACATQPTPVVTALPAVAADKAATLTVRSKPNFSDVKHRHLLIIDGVAAGKFKEDDVKTFKIAEGRHNLKMTCHSRFMRSDNVLPFNYNVVDGKTEIDIDVLAGDTLCMKISFNPLQCSILRETAPSYCE